MKVDLKLDNCEAINLPRGVIYLGPSDKSQSIGFLKLNPGQKLARHNRPVDEKLKQISGDCIIELYDKDRLLQEKELRQEEELIISANQYHVHKNPTSKESLTYWQFDGDITKIIENIRKSKK